MNALLDIAAVYVHFSTTGFVFPKPLPVPREEAERGEEGQVRQRADPGGRSRQEQAVVPLSMLRQRLEGIWASASSNRRLAEVKKEERDENHDTLHTVCRSTYSSM